MVTEGRTVISCDCTVMAEVWSVIQDPWGYAVNQSNPWWSE